MHSWIKANGDDSDSNATFDERISDIIPSTCGGGRRRISIGSVLSRHNNSISPFITPPRPENKAKKNMSLETENKSVVLLTALFF
ncbi:hypothetical protein Mgra_00007978 [Meloidogyne graminicola]|uniref:Uncharacterized protein n=1 Tax=Meloidogyne graminicola TaxID=189291 RepID=A0A8S9ZH04_9BILA|nr:hypothetical protein Mgra_00007978 [Meloidogyne graminicola]